MVNLLCALTEILNYLCASLCLLYFFLSLPNKKLWELSSMNSNVSSGSEILILRWGSDISHHYWDGADGRAGNLTALGIYTGSVQFCLMEMSLPGAVHFTHTGAQHRNLHREVQVAIFSVLWDNAISETSTGWQGCYFLTAFIHLLLFFSQSLSQCAGFPVSSYYKNWRIQLYMV